MRFYRVLENVLCEKCTGCPPATLEPIRIVNTASLLLAKCAKCSRPGVEAIPKTKQKESETAAYKRRWAKEVEAKKALPIAGDLFE